MFRLAKITARLNGRVAAFGTPSLHRTPIVARQWSPSIAQRASFATKKDGKADPPPPKQPIDHEEERRIGERKLEARPDQVSVASSTSNNLKTPVENTAGGPIMQAELKHDMGIIKSTFSMNNVPQESKILGLAGTLPYFATSLSTLYLSWDLRQNLPTGSSFFDSIVIDHGTAQYLLSVIEPVQLGYGAVIISFLGAIHWGLEYAETKPSPRRTRFRYGMGLAASIVAWPTLFMPVPYALTTQFLGFVGLYFADANAATRGWAPSWYGTYRFMLTAMVGAAILISLIGRQKVNQGNTLTTEGLTKRLEQTGRADHETDWDALEKKEREKRRKEREEKEKKEAEEKKKKAKKGGKKGKKDGEEGQNASSDKKEDEKKDGADEEGDEDKDDKEKDDTEDKDNDETDDSKDDGDDKSGEEQDGEKKDKSDDADDQKSKEGGQDGEKEDDKDKESK